jgi:hypothetical protein
MAGSRESHPETNDPAKGSEREREIIVDTEMPCLHIEGIH